MFGYNATVPQPDTGGAALSSYLIGLVNEGRWRRPLDWGALAAWSWGISRIIDFFETYPDVDATRVAVQGHSRFGKATLVAAYDERVAAAFPSSAGALGTSWARRAWGGFGDAWTDPRGMYLAGAFASPAWELLGWPGQVIPAGTVFTSGPGESIGGTPPLDVAFIDGTVGWRRHSAGHTPVPDWPSSMQLAARHLDGHRPVVRPGQHFGPHGGTVRAAPHAPRHVHPAGGGGRPEADQRAGGRDDPSRLTVAPVRRRLTSSAVPAAAWWR